MGLVLEVEYHRPVVGVDEGGLQVIEVDRDHRELPQEPPGCTVEIPVDFDVEISEQAGEAREVHDPTLLLIVHY